MIKDLYIASYEQVLGKCGELTQHIDMILENWNNYEQTAYLQTTKESSAKPPRVDKQTKVYKRVCILQNTDFKYIFHQ